MQYGLRGPLPHPGETGLASFGRVMARDLEQVEWCREFLRKHRGEPRLSVAFPAGSEMRCPAPTSNGVCGGWLGKLKENTRAIVRVLMHRGAQMRVLPPIDYPSEIVQCDACKARLEKFLTYATDLPARV